MRKYHVGIDFGTTNSSLALLDPRTNKVEMKKVDVGERPFIIRSILSKDLEGHWMIGNQAAAIDHLKQRSVFSIKTELRRNPSFQITIDEEKLGIQQLIAVFLTELMSKAGISSPREVERLCLSVPVNFDENSKSIMEQAAVSIGIPLKQIWFLDEPVSVLWDCHTIQGQYVLVFDFGGGTLDLAIMDKYESEDQVETQDDHHYKGKILAKLGLDIGGDDLDDVIIRYFIEQGKQQGNSVCESISLDLFDDPERLHKLKNHPKFSFYYQLKTMAEKAKHMLSNHEQYSLSIPPLVPGIDDGIKGITITLEQFMVRTENIRDKMMHGLKQLNDQFHVATKLKRNAIEAVLLSGGSSLLSFVPDLLEELYPNARIVWDEQQLQTRIARGNARYTRSEGEMLVGDLVNANYGIYNHAGKETIVMIEQTELYPVHKLRRVATTKVNQTEIEIVPMVKQGVQKTFERLKKNGHPVFWRMKIQAHHQTMDLSRITVTYTIDKSQTLRVSAYDHMFQKEIGIEEISLKN